MQKVESFPPSVRIYGLLGLFGVVSLVTSLIVVHSKINNFDWMNEYVSNLANESLGRVFIAGGFIHGCGNLALVLGLRGALRPGRLRNWATLTFGFAAVGILLTALFPIDAPDAALSVIGRLHRASASVTFTFELAALFIFTLEFRRDRRWHRHQLFSKVLSISTAIAMMLFVIAIQVKVAPGLAERIALMFFIVWEIWICRQLIRKTSLAAD